MRLTTITRFGATLALALSLGAIGVLAQGRGAGPAPPQGPAQGPGAGATPGAPGAPAPPRQGFESNVQLTSTYTPQESSAVAVVEEWVKQTAAHNLDGAMAVLDDKILVRPDPARQMAVGPVAQCSSYPFTRIPALFVRLDEVYAVGGPLDSMVMFKRSDINGPAGPRGGFTGFTVQVAVMVRVGNGRITEWLDAPINRVGGLVTDGPLGQPPGGANVAEACRKYPLPRAAASAPLVPAGPSAQMPTYATSKPEQFWNAEEIQAAQAVRSWFGSWQAGDPLLLGAFLDQNVVFRANAAAPLVKGRADMLRAVCGSIGGPRRLVELYPLGSDFDTMVLTESVTANGARIASMFRVQHNLITEWLDVVVEAPNGAPAANPSAPACQVLNSALAAR